jgi:DNA-binding NtrC family response regulator
MATAKKGIIGQALKSKPVKTAKGLVDSAIEAFNDPPLAPDIPAKTRRPAAKKSAAGSRAKSSDRKLVAVMEDYEVKYLAQKHKVTQKAVKEAAAKVGSSRNKVEAELKRRAGNGEQKGSPTA